MKRQTPITDEMVERACVAYFGCHAPYDWDWWLARFTLKSCDAARANIRRALEAVFSESAPPAQNEGGR